MIRAACLTSRFCLPEQGMETYELLASGSAFCATTAAVDGASAPGPSLRQHRRPAFRVLASLHVAQPFLYPHYFPEAADWLSFVRPHHVRCTLDLQLEGSEFPVSLPLSQQILRHETRDVCALHLCEDEASVAERLEREHDVRLHVFSLDDCGYNAQDGLRVKVEGHRVKHHDHETVVTPVSLPGQVLASDIVVRQQVRSDPTSVVEHELLLVDTRPELLEMGMCGGPCLEGEELLGLIEGKLPSDSKFAELGAVIPRSVLRALVTGG